MEVRLKDAESHHVRSSSKIGAPKAAAARAAESCRLCRARQGLAEAAKMLAASPTELVGKLEENYCETVGAAISPIRCARRVRQAVPRGQAALQAAPIAFRPIRLS